MFTSRLTLPFFAVFLAVIFAFTSVAVTGDAFASDRDKRGKKVHVGDSDSHRGKKKVKGHEKHERKVKRGEGKAARHKHDKNAKRREESASQHLDRGGWRFGSHAGSHKKRAAVKRHESRNKIERHVERRDSRRHKKSGRIYRPRYGQHDRRMVFNRHDRHRRVRVRGIDHYYQHGYFYRRGPYGYFLVNAPIGAVVWSLGFGFDTIWVGGSSYYYYGGAYYQRVPAGYVVVAPPVNTVISQESSGGPVGSVVIEASTLNVRARPGRNHRVIDQLYEGDIVTVYGTTSEWFYIELPNGYFGWILRDCRNLQAPYVCG
ncbi:MAG: DUF6515 family protein [Thermodesulfobacteriota bacterium]